MFSIPGGGRSARVLAYWMLILLFWLPISSAWAADQPILALLPVRVHSSENPIYLREGLADMLVARFRQSGVFQLKQIEDPSQATTELNEAVKIAREAGADFVLFGSFTRFGAGASLDMQAATTAENEPGESMREIFVHSGSIAEVIPDLDELVGKVTQFATTEYPDRSQVESAASPGAGGDPMAELKRRVAVLEAQLTALQSDSTAPLGPASP